MNKERWIARAKELGLEALEITQVAAESREISWFEGTVNTFVTSRILSTALRALYDGKIVSIAVENARDEEMDTVLGGLKEAASVVSDTEKDVFVGVMETEELPSLHKWTVPSVEEIKELMASVEKKLTAADPRVSQVSSLEWNEHKANSTITNSLGVHVQDKIYYQVFVAAVTMQENSQVRDGYLVEPVSSIAEFDQDAFVKKLIEKVSSQLGAVSLDSRNTPVVIENKAMGSLLACYSGLFSGSLIAKGISPIAGRLHEQIFSDKITIIDNPRNQDAIFMQNYDDEGHPTYSKVVVNHGVFELMLHNTKSALKMNASSTGNGFKSGAGATGVSPMNMYIEPGKDSLDELLAQMKDGVLITDLAGMHAGVDFVSGNFSLQAQGYLIENGKKTKALTLITIAGNFLDLMNKVQAVGNDLEWKTRAIASPSILFSQASIGGNE